MKASLDIAFFGSSLVSSYWNGAATYYRGLLRALAERGHRITFYEPDAFERQQHRDIEDPAWARVVVYSARSPDHVLSVVRQARGADLVVKASGVGVHDALLEAAVLELQSATTWVAFWDVDAPATLERVQENPSDPFRALIPRYDLVFTYGGGQPVIDAYAALGAQRCVPVYNALDPHTHHPVPPSPRFTADLAFLGNRLPDRERRVEQFLLEVAASRPERTFLLGGAGWDNKPRAGNVRYLGHVPTADHNAFNCTPTAVLNINRDSMARFGFSPPTRVFEAAGASACLVTDAWEGIELFLEPGKEILVARSGEEVASLVDWLASERAAAASIGVAALRRVLAEHTYAHRAAQVAAVLEGADAIRPTLVALD
jgi:spore maturation protein CgeB